VPKKAMWLAAHLAERIELAAQLGFEGLPSEGRPQPKLDWCEFITHRQRYIAGIHASYRRRLDEAGIVTVASRGRLLDARTVECADGVRLRAPRIVIATGGRPRRPSIPGAELGMVSDDFFNLSAAPARVAVVGGGYIGVELAGVLGMLGSEVEMFVRGPRLLQGFDADLAARLQDNYHQAGIALHLGREVRALARDGGRLRVRDQGGREGAFDAVLFATGRQPNTAGLGLEEAGIALDPAGYVQVDEWQDTSVRGVHAVGDVTDRVALTPVAIAAARRLMDRLFGGVADARLDYDNIATVVFAHPPLGTVGLTAEQARAFHGEDVHEYRAEFRAMLHALADAPQRSLFKLVCEGAERREVGIHQLGEGADEILQGFAVALKKGIVLDDLRDTVAIHPTSAEEIVLMR
jgi:glutathione reductase (NADPH)